MGNRSIRQRYTELANQRRETLTEGLRKGLDWIEASTAASSSPASTLRPPSQPSLRCVAPHSRHQARSKLRAP